MPPDKADSAQTNGFKAFPGIWQGNSLIQSRYPEDFRLFPTKQSGYPCHMPSSDSSPPSLSPVTRRDRPCASFKAPLGRMYHEEGISARWADVRQRHFSPNPPILPGSKSVQVKERVAFRHPDARNTAPGKAVRYFSMPPNLIDFAKLGGLKADFHDLTVYLWMAKTYHVHCA